ncbi:MAG: hypothetical protein LBR33_03440 [Propionibacteriaceae bacterium]|jgi:hypothetical protein|nr:hypothetical protein [Propionibacteriaceae bacterium]
MSDKELSDRVAALLGEIKGLKLEVKRLSAKTAAPDEEHAAVIAAAVAAYLGLDRTKSQASYPPSPVWSANTRRAQHAHHPLYS